jgi:hypothetical protein
VWSYDEELLTGTIGSNNVLTLVAKPNNTGAVIKAIATVMLPNGLSAGATLTINPVPLADIPVAEDAGIEISENLAALSYELPLTAPRDISLIEWYRESGADTANGVHIGTTRTGGAYIDDPYTDYVLTKYDIGSYLRAVITPKYQFGSQNGETVTVYTDRAITADDITDNTLLLDFKNMNIEDAPLDTTGRFFFDGGNTPWTWGLGTNGAEGLYGLQNANRNASTAGRMVYGQSGKFGDMAFQLNLSPGKVEGQGFGGNGQFMDIFVKYDPVTRTGYGVRFERVARLGLNAVEWRLYKYEGNSQSVLAGPYDAAIAPKTSITLSVEGDTLSVKSTTESAQTPSQAENNLPNVVSLSWTDETGGLSKNTFGGFGVRIVNSGTPSINGGAGTNNCMMLLDAKVTAAEAEDFSDGKVRVRVDGAATATTEDSVDYTLSAANLNKLATVTVWLETDGKFLAHKAVEGLNGFSVLGDIAWEDKGDNRWSGRVTLTNTDGGVTSEAYVDLLKLTLDAKEELGGAYVKIARIDLSGYDAENAAVYFDSIIRNGEVDTEIVQYISGYDVNRDGNINQLDLTAAQLYYMSESTDSDWEASRIADVNSDNIVDIQDFILILNNIVW